jgi:hypothetical protein
MLGLHLRATRRAATADDDELEGREMKGSLRAATGRVPEFTDHYRPLQSKKRKNYPQESQNRFVGRSPKNPDRNDRQWLLVPLLPS